MEFLKNKLFINIIYGLLLVFTLISFFVSYLINRNIIDIPILGHINADLRINLETGKDNIKNIRFFINGQKRDPYVWRNPNTYIVYESGFQNVYNIAIKAKSDKDIEKIQDIVVYVGDKMFYYTGKEILNFKKTKEGKYVFPREMKFCKSSVYINDKGALKHLTYGILSVFYNWKFYIIPILSFVLTFLIYCNNKDKINLGFNLFRQNAIWLIIFFAFLIRICDLSFDLWSDELYTITVAGWPQDSFIWTFKDPGNPPFFFILAKLWMMIVGVSEFRCRLLTVIISCMSVYFVYRFIKDNLDIQNSEKIGLLAAFLCAINIYSIQEAQDFRAYSLGGLLCILSAYYLFKILKNKKTVDYVIYAVLAICMFNTHYFQSFILLANFIYAMIFMNRKERIKFFTANLIGGLTFLPFFFMTAYKQALLNPLFNTFISAPSLTDFINNTSRFFCSYAVVPFLLIIFYLFFISKNKNNLFEEDEKFKKIFAYVAYMIFFVIISIHLFSQIKPIVKDFYFTNILPFSPILLAMVFLLPFKKKAHKVLSSLFLFLILFSGKAYFNKGALNRIIFKPIVEYASVDAVQFRKQGKKIAIFMHDAQQEATREMQIKSNNKNVKNMDSYLRFYKNFLKGDEKILTYYYGVSPYKAHMMLKESGADVAYMRVENRKFVKFSMEFEDDYVMSVIRCNKDILIARFKKR